jgi:hypothetical protein
MRSKKMKLAGRIILFITAICILSVVFTSLDVAEITADAASLPHIEEILANNGTYRILEIVPDAAAATFGYYVAGQEPIANWKDQLAAMENPTVRTEYVNGLFSGLVAAGLMSETEATPLSYTGGSYYSEQYEVTDPDNWNTITLDHREKSVVTGVFSDMQDGPYSADYAYVQEEKGGYIQNIEKFEYTAAPAYGEGAYYYNPTFTLIVEEGENPTDLDQLISQIGDFAVYTQDDTGIYTYYGKISEGLRSGDQYYYVSPNETGAPGGEGSGCYYMAVVYKDDESDGPQRDGFIATAGASYFARKIISYTYVGQGGKYTFSPTGTETHEVYYQKVYFKAGFENNNWFKRHVFGLDGNDFDRIDVVVTVREANEVTLSDVTDADMIYLSTGAHGAFDDAVTAYTAENELTDSDGQAMQIYKAAAGEAPVIVDYSIIQGITSSTPASEIGTMEKLALLCLQSELPATEETSLSALTIDWLKLTYISNDVDQCFVNNNVFCFDAMNAQSTSGPPDINNLVTPHFTTVFDMQVQSDGFSAVLSEIQAENILKQIAKESLLPEEVTLAAAVRHIINFSGRRQTTQKDHIRVLDLEPAKVTSNTWLKPETVRTWINDPTGAINIDIVHMTTGEFVGKIEDINETYDMVYIGMSTENLHTDNGITVYNDPSMNGLIYSNIGDTFYASIELAGIRQQDYVTQNGVKAIDGTSDSFANFFRFSGNDITKAKVNELQEFVEAGYPLILANGFVSGDVINEDTVDNSSYMYAAVSAIYHSYPNVMSQDDAKLNYDTVIKYLNVSKPEILITEKPVEYAENGPVLSPDENNAHYYLNYRFSIKNVTDATPISTTYDCNLYIDLNADGRYTEGEELTDIEVTRISDNLLVTPVKDATGKAVYTLYADVEYAIKRQMADDYAGIIPWQLEVVKNGADHVHASAQGYTRIKPISKKPLNILQIMKSNSTSSLLNLQDQLKGGSVANAQLLGKDGKYYKGIYGKLIADLDDFNVTITAIEADDLEAMTPEKIDEELNKHDMLIIGFADMFGEMGEKGAPAVVKYIESGRSVLFTHDTTSVTNTESGTQMATAEKLPATDNLDNADVVYDPSTSVYKSADGNINWYDTDYSTVVPPNITEDASLSNPVYVVFLKRSNTYESEAEYYDQRIAVYKVTGTGTKYAPVTQFTSSYNEFRDNYGWSTPVIYVYSSVSGWYGVGTYATRYNITSTSSFTRFVGIGNDAVKFSCNGVTYKYAAGYKPSRSRDYDDVQYSPFTYNETVYGWLIKSIMNGTTTSYRVAGTYDAATNTYMIDGQLRYPGTGLPFLQKTLYVSDPANALYTFSSLPNSISDWGYYFNTVIRDFVGLDRYGVTNPSLSSIVDSIDSLTEDEMKTVLNNNRSVAYAPNSNLSTTVAEYQGYTNYALIRFTAARSTFKYTKSAYNSGDRETNTVSQVNKGQITSYPYDVNTASFGGTDPKILASGKSFMSIGKTHEQYYQINMNTDDIVVWYCLSGGSAGSSYYDDVPNDVVNAYYIYNKGNVTYSGVGHTSSASLYGGSSIGQEYVNEAKLFVNTMIAAYQATSKLPTITILKSPDSTLETNVGYVRADNTMVLEGQLDWNDQARAIYFKIANTNMEEAREITASYYYADPEGAVVIDGKAATLMQVSTYYTNNAESTEFLQGGFVYKFYLPNEVMDALSNPDISSLEVCITATTKIGGVDKTVSKWIEIRKIGLFDLT